LKTVENQLVNIRKLIDAKSAALELRVAKHKHSFVDTTRTALERHRGDSTGSLAFKPRPPFAITK